MALLWTGRIMWWSCTSKWNFFPPLLENSAYPMNTIHKHILRT